MPELTISAIALAWAAFKGSWGMRRGSGLVWSKYSMIGNDCNNVWLSIWSTGSSFLAFSLVNSSENFQVLSFIVFFYGFIINCENILNTWPSSSRLIDLYSKLIPFKFNAKRFKIKKSLINEYKQEN